MVPHLYLHLTLCAAIAKLSPDAVVPIHVKLTYRNGGEPALDKTFRVKRGDGTEAVVEFDADRNFYALHVDVPKYDCSTSDFLDVLEEQNRTISETLEDGPPQPQTPVTILDGTAPQSFTYVKPTFALFDNSVTCGQPVTAPIPAKIKVEYDQGSYYVWMYPDATLAARGPLSVAMRLRTATGTYHYVHLPVEFPRPWGGWPYSIRFPVTEDMIDGLATEKTDTLLCPKLWATSAH